MPASSGKNAATKASLLQWAAEEKSRVQDRYFKDRDKAEASLKRVREMVEREFGK